MQSNHFLGAWAGLLAFGALLFVGCGAGGSRGPLVSSAFTAANAKVFDDGVDFVSGTAALEGQWLEDWQRDLDQRIRDADVIMIGPVRSLRTDIDPESRTTYRIALGREVEVWGDAPEELSLVSPQGGAGFGGIGANLARIESGVFIAFVKWYKTDAGTVAAHWHLCPASAELRQYTDGAVRRVRLGETGPKRTVIVHKLEGN